MIDHGVIGMLLNCDPFQVLADIVEPGNARLKIMDHPRPATTGQLDAMIRAHKERHRRPHPMGWNPKWKHDRLSGWGQITIRNRLRR
jgi:hypothetical protein